MQETKVYCDLCGKEISNPRPFEVNIEHKTSLSRNIGKLNDCCLDCDDILYNALCKCFYDECDSIKAKRKKK